MSKHAINLIPEHGEHALLVGQNGSGKTALACWILLRIKQAPILIYDTKIEPKFAKLPNNVIVETMVEAYKYKDDPTIDYIVIRPPVEMMYEPRLLDDMLKFHYLHFQHCVAYIDEAYTFHVNGRAGPGLTGLLTRGRSRGISTIISTQRPVMLSRFCITEAKKAYVLTLSDKADKKRLDDIIPNFSDLPKPAKHGFYFFQVGMEEPLLFQPFKLDQQFDTGYTDTGADTAVDASNDASNRADNSPVKHLWV